MRRILLAAGLAALLTPASHGQVLTIGTSDARLCYEASTLDHPSRSNAVDTCREAIAAPETSRRDRAATYVNLGIVHAKLGDHQPALEAYNTAIEVMPSLAEAYLNRGALHLRQDSGLDAAIADFTRSLELGLNEPYKAHYNRALAYERLDQLEEAYADLNTAVAMQPEWELARQELERYSVVEGGARS